MEALRKIFTWSVLLVVALNLVAAEDELPANFNDLVKTANTEAAGAENVNEWSKDLATWEPSEDLKKELPCYHAGYDDLKRPLFVMEFGRWDCRKWVEAGGENFTNFDKYFEKFWYTIDNTPPLEGGEEGFSLIIDMDKFSARQLASIGVVRNQLIQARRAERIEPRLANFWIINMNFVAQTWTNIIRPIAGKFVGKADLFGPNKAKWLAEIHQKVSKDQLPEWYGGSKDFKPIKIYG